MEADRDPVQRGPRACLGGLVGDQQLDPLARRDRANECGDFGASGLEVILPQLGMARPRSPAGDVARPFGGLTRGHRPVRAASRTLLLASRMLRNSAVLYQLGQVDPLPRIVAVSTKACRSSTAPSQFQFGSYWSDGL